MERHVPSKKQHEVTDFGRLVFELEDDRYGKKWPSPSTARCPF